MLTSDTNIKFENELIKKYITLFWVYHKSQAVYPWTEVEKGRKIDFDYYAY